MNAETWLGHAFEDLCSRVPNFRIRRSNQIKIPFAGNQFAPLRQIPLATEFDNRCAKKVSGAPPAQGQQTYLFVS